MNKNEVFVGVLIEETTTFSFTEVCHKYNIPEELLVEMIEQGLFPNQPSQKEKIVYDSKSLKRIESAFRLHKDLGINLAGVALALELLDEIEHMRCELTILRKHF